MRIRVCYLIESLLNNKKATNSNFYQLLSDRGLQKEEIEKYIDIYKKVREGEKISIKLKKEDILSLINILNKYLKEHIKILKLIKLKFKIIII